jgi:hypothetical protein
MNRESTPLPEPIAQLQLQLEQIRRTQARRSRLPESVWSAAIELARQHGINRVAHALRLDYAGLKKRVNGLPSRRPNASRTAFVELVTPPATMLPECVIEFESASGGKMRIQWKAAVPPDWTSLLRAWRETAG